MVNQFITKGLKIGAFLSAFFSILIGIFLFTEIPKKVGFYRWLSSKDPHSIGFFPASNYGIPWGFTFEELNKLNLHGQTSVVTGANSGIGYALTEALYRLGAKVTMACRNEQKCIDAADEIKKTTLSSSFGIIETMVLDTSSLASVRTFAQLFLEKLGDEKSLDMLFLNAGMVYTKETKCVPESVDGIEKVFATNYLGHHLLYRLLEPALNRSSMARVVSTSSNAAFHTYRYKVATDLKTLNGCIEKFARGAINLSYGQSKLAQIIWTKYLTRKLGTKSNIYVNAFHPGLAATNLIENANKDNEKWKYMSWVFDWIRREVMWTSSEGALTGLYLGVAVDKIRGKNIRGKYFHPQSVEVINVEANNESLQEKLWIFSEELVKDYLVDTSSNANTVTS